MSKSRDSNPRKLRELLVESRLNAGLTQQEVARYLGKPQSFLAKIEGGGRRLDVIEFIKLCDALEVKPSRLINALMRKK